VNSDVVMDSNFILWTICELYNCGFIFLSFYCDYNVDEFCVIFCIFQKKLSEIINFRRPQ
jgi:hypothetical protein